MTITQKLKLNPNTKKLLTKTFNNAKDAHLIKGQEISLLSQKMSIKYSINLNLYYSFKPSPFFGCKTRYTKHNKGGNKELLTLTYRILLTQFSNRFWLHSYSQKLNPVTAQINLIIKHKTKIDPSMLSIQWIKPI